MRSTVILAFLFSLALGHLPARQAITNWDLDLAINSSANAYYFVGGYNPYIYVVSVQYQAPNAINIVGQFPSGNSASFLSLLGNTLVAVNELDSFSGIANTGGITSFKVNIGPDRLQVKQISAVASRGSGPAFVSQTVTSSRKQIVLAANYNGGNYGTFSVQMDSSVTATPLSFQQDTGSGPNPDRQTSPHPHQITTDLNRQYVFVPDLGTDRIMQYVLNADGSLTVNPKAASVVVSPGSGPRHAAFHPNGKYAYVTNEMASRLDAYSFSKATGTLTLLKGYSMVESGSPYAAQSTAAEVKITNDGKFVYGSNRNGTDSIVIFKVDSETGALSTVGWEKTRGSIPRFFTLAHHDKWLFVANQNSNNLVLFSRDPSTGKLTYVNQQAGGIVSPTCIVHAKLV
eukprot:TRINITY_DN689_c0_g1_i1.p1 TRINITY_DN689_c0_g1~~TRINITY_DN689_c0_g1_i1.p1  ORF type:complete len:421 (-),score=101.80 TRINITY_DN689_c0_g1_i1:108-1310(-)